MKIRNMPLSTAMEFDKRALFPGNSKWILENASRFKNRLYDNLAKNLKIGALLKLSQ
jgi:hypothetical protein